VALSHIDLFNKYASDDIKEKVELQCKKNKEIDLEKLKKLKDQIIKNAKALGEVNEKNIAKAWAYSYQKTVVKKINTSEEGKDLCYDCQHFKRCQKRKDDEKAGKTTIECKSYKSFKELPNRTLQKTIEVWKKYFPNIDINRLYLRLAHYLANDEKTDCLFWLIEVSRSAGGKTTLSKPFSWAPKVITLNELTSKGIFSGASDIDGKKVKDMSFELQNRRRVLIVTETAGIKALGYHGIKKLMAQFKQLFDQEVKQSSGSTGRSDSEELMTSVWFNSTKDIREYQTAMELAGTCFLFYTVDDQTEHDLEDSLEAMKQQGIFLKAMKEIKIATMEYLANHKLNIKSDEVSESIQKWIAKEAFRLSRLRVAGNYDKNLELKTIPSPEKPTRISKQFQSLYMALHSMGLNDEDVKQIIRKISDSSADETLLAVVEYLSQQMMLKEAGKDTAIDDTLTFETLKVMESTVFSRYEVKKRLELLAGLGYLKKIYLDDTFNSKVAYQLNIDKDNEEWKALFRQEKPTVSDKNVQIDIDEDVFDDLEV